MAMAHLEIRHEAMGWDVDTAQHRLPVMKCDHIGHHRQWCKGPVLTLGLMLYYWPKYLAPTIFVLSKKKNITMQQALTDDAWVQDINIRMVGSSQQLSQFLDLWQGIQEVQLNPNEMDQTTWKLSMDGEYSAHSAYMAQFLDPWIGETWMGIFLDLCYYLAQSPNSCRMVACCGQDLCWL